MNLSTIVTIIYAVGIIIGALFLDIWGAETSLSKAMAGVAWTVLFLIALFYKKKTLKKDSIPARFVKKHIYYYYATFWIIIIIFLLLKD